MYNWLKYKVKKENIMKIKMLLIKNLKKKRLCLYSVSITRRGGKGGLHCISKTDIDMYLLWFKGTIQTLSTGWIGWGYISNNLFHCLVDTITDWQCSNFIQFNFTFQKVQKVRVPLLDPDVSKCYNFVYETF